jgi:hypothetical protein
VKVGVGFLQACAAPSGCGPASLVGAAHAVAHIELWQLPSVVSALVHVPELPVAHASAQLMSVQSHFAKHA